MSAPRVAWGLWGLAALLVVPGPVLQTIVGWHDEADLLFMAGFIAMQVGTATTGAVVASRIPRNSVGWIFLGMGVGMAVAVSTDVYATLGLTTDSGPLPGDDVVAWISNWIFIPVMFGLPLLLLLIFPDGRFRSRRWRMVGIALGTTVALASVALAFKPGEISGLGVQNPLAFSGSLGEAMKALESITNLLALPGFMLAIAGLVTRFRAARGVERQQLKWFTYVAAFVAVGLAGGVVVSEPPVGDIFFLVALVALAGLPIAAGLAILRYRLYDIDLVIRRTLVYAALTATLVASYLAGVLLLQFALGPLTEDNDLAIAGSTLAAAALFRPASARIQSLVDRRFYRRKYDASRTIEEFGARLRDQVELDALSSELRGVVGQTMQPAHVSLWLRQTA